MSTKRKATKSRKSPASIVWFEIPANDIKRANKFYSSLFGWKIKQFPGMEDYWHIDTGGADATPDGGMMTRKYPEQPITNYIFVDSVTKSATKVKRLGGNVCMDKTAVPGMGYFVVCQDTEGNTFSLWERNEKAK